MLPFKLIFSNSLLLPLSFSLFSFSHLPALTLKFHIPLSFFLFFLFILIKFYSITTIPLINLYILLSPISKPSRALLAFPILFYIQNITIPTNAPRHSKNTKNTVSIPLYLLASRCLNPSIFITFDDRPIMPSILFHNKGLLLNHHSLLL